MTRLRFIPKALLIGALLCVFRAYGQGGDYLEQPPVEPRDEAYVEYMCHLQDIRDTKYYPQPLMCGTKLQKRRLEGFAIRLGPHSERVDLQYMAHLQKIGDTGWVPLGSFIGTRGQGRRLEGFAIRVVGPAADRYDVWYAAHIKSEVDDPSRDGDTPWARNG